MTPLHKQKSARIAILEAYSLDLSSKPWDALDPMISGTKSAGAGQQWEQVQAGKIIALIERLPQPVKSWVKWAYGPQLEGFSGPEYARLTSWISSEVYSSAGQGAQPITIERIINACALAAFNARHTQNTGGPIYTAKQIRDALGLSHRQQWARDIKPWYEKAGDWFELFDRRGLASVSGLIRIERAAFDKEDPANLPGDGWAYIKKACEY